MLVHRDAVALGPGGIPRSAETLFNVVKLADNGYMLSAADYIGNGRSKTTQAYAVKGSTNQTIQDMLTAAKALSRKLGYNSDQLMLNGWSQGGLNTQWLGNALQRNGETPDRLAGVSSPSDLEAVMNHWLNDYPGNPPWLTAVTPLLLGSYENTTELMG